MTCVLYGELYNIVLYERSTRARAPNEAHTRQDMSSTHTKICTNVTDENARCTRTNGNRCAPCACH